MNRVTGLGLPDDSKEPRSGTPSPQPYAAEEVDEESVASGGKQDANWQAAVRRASLSKEDLSKESKDSKEDLSKESKESAYSY